MPPLLPGVPAAPLSAGTPSLVTAPADPPGRAIDDPAVVRRAIFDNALSTVQSLPPVTSSTHTLRFANAGYEGPENVGMRAYKQALLTGDTLARRLRADMELVDNASGAVLDSRRTTLAAVPYYTDAGVFVNRGTKYAMANQQRLRPGAYTRERDNGEVETHFNVPPGQGMPFRVFLDPASGVFKARVGQAQIPLVPLLQSLGVTEPELRTAWGSRLATANVAKVRGGDTHKLYSRLVRNGKSTTEPEQMAEMRQLLENTKLDPDVMRHTLGSPFERVNATALLTATRKLLAIHNRKDPEMLKQLGLEPAEQDDRDHLAFMRLLGPEDIIAERLRTSPKVLRPLLWKAGRTGKLEHVAPGVLTRLVQDAILGSGLGQATEDINPLQVFEQQLRVTRMGVGGIPSADSIPDSSRSVQPSHAGYIDPIVTPECFDDQTEVMTRRGWVPWPQVTSLDEFAVQLDGQLAWRHAEALHAGPYAGQMVVVDTDILNFCVTPNHRLWTRPDQAGDSKYRFEEARYSYHRARKFACAGHQAAAGEPQTVYHIPPVARGANNQVVLPPIDLGDWAEFLGWFLSEGSTYVCLKPKLRHYVVNISQSRAANPQLYADLLTLCARLPFSVCSDAKGITVSGKQLTLYCRQFGLCYDKFIPSEAFDWPAAARRRLLVGLLKGDGRKGQFDIEKLVGLQYCTTSPRLAADVERLVFSLGFSSRTVIEPENRAEHYHDSHIVHIHSRWERSAQKRHLWRLEPYVGTVYCATVPGGLLYVRRNGKVGHWSGNSANAGIDVRLSRLARKGPDGELYSKFTDMRTGDTSWKQPKELFDSVIAFSTARLPTPSRPFDAASYAKFKNALDRGEVVQSKSGRYFTQGIQRGQLDYYPLESVDYAIPHMENAFSPTANLVPGKSAMKGQRVAMGARMQTQALPLVDAEAPLVQSGVPGESGSFEALYGARMGAVRAPQGGRVLAVNPDSVMVQYDDGQKAEIELAQHVPGARKTYLQQDAVVAAGDTFQPGQLLARSNFTDKDGTAALGRNLRTAWMSLKGYNYEDAVVLSESGAKKLTSQHMYKTAVDIDKDSDRVGLATYRGMFPKRFTKEQLAKVDEHGVVRVGQRVESGDPLVLVAGERKGRVGEVSRAGSSRFRDSAETWEHDHPGVVTDVAKTKNGVVVAVKSIAPMQVGDKLSNRFGSKGVVAAILPDDEMPQDENGQPIELALNELGITTRTNPIQAIEAVLGKVAQKRGQPYHLPDFDQITDLRAYAQREAAQHGVKDREELLDPETGNKIPGIITGPHFVMKLHHVAESKVSGRSFGAYTADGTPSKGGPEGAKTWGMLHLNALLSHGAVQVAKDGHAVRGQRNPAYWAAVMAGKAPPDPEVPPVYRKFVAQLQATGIHPVREGTRTHLMAMTNAGIKELAGDREVTSPDTVDWNDEGMKPIAGGLFDERLFGGVNGERWAKITLPEPLPSPVMEEPIRRVLGLTGPQFERILGGQEQLNGETGSAAIANALGRVNVDAEIERATREIRGTRKTARDAATRRVGFLLGARKTGIHPRDWMWDSVPVMPPRWRPVNRMQGTGSPMVADANYLYRDLFQNKQNFEQLRDQVSDVGDERLALYQSLRAVTGLGDPAPEHLKEQQIKGALQHIIGSSPKFGVVQRRLLGSQTDLVGRGTIVPNPDLDMDQVGIPEDQAWQVYRPFLVGHMAKRGVAPGRAAEMVAARTDVARRALTEVMRERPVLLDRAPVLHRYGVMAFWPRIAKGNQIELTPIVTKGFGADFDGDAMQFHVPGSDKAVDDAVEKMLPSANLRAPSNFKVHQLPQQEYLAGLYRATRDRKNVEPVRFPTTKAMLAALSRGTISHDQPVIIEADEES